MSAVLAAARAAWPTVDLPSEVFAAHLRSRVPAGQDPGEALGRMYTSDLYLACACSRGDVRAVAEFERRCLGPAGEALSRMRGLAPDVIEEVVQRVRCSLLVGDPPGIVEFGGRGSLRRWVRVIAVREALAMRRGAVREVPVDDGLLERALLDPADPEMEYLKRLYREEFAAAAAQALRGLGPRDRALLRASLVEGLGIDELAARHGVHRATAARRLERARRGLSARTVALLVQRLRVRSSDVHSILRFIRSGLHVSTRLLRRSPRRRGR